MPLSSALFSGLSGLDANQTALNVVGNNIANSNTTAFKASRVLFTPQFYVTDNPGSPSDQTFGGSNPSQEGLGASVGAVEQDFTEGQLQTTGKNTDMAINGSGFFIVQSGNAQNYTRDGSFNLNDKDQLVDSAGGFVMGYGVNSNFQIQNTTLQKLQIPLGSETIAKATANATFQGNLNVAGAVATDASQLTTQALQSSDATPITAATPLTNLQSFGGTTSLFNVGQTLTVAGVKGNATLPSQTFTVTAGSTVQDLQNFFQDGLGIDTAPPAGSPGPTPGVSIANAAGGGQQLIVTGNIGSDNAISLAGSSLTSSTGASPFAFTDTGGANGESAQTTVSAYDSLGTPISVQVNAVLVGKSATGSTWNYFASSPDNQGTTTALSSGTLTFDTNGKLLAQTGNTVTINRAGTGAAPLQNITLDFSDVQSLSDSSSDIVSPSQDGFQAGTLNNFSVGADGTITGTFSNGLTRTIGQVAIANFANPEGLVDQGGSIYSSGADSGTAVISAPEQMSAGSIQAGALESSNVDLSKEFINLITYSTGFSASSKVISTSDQLLTDLLNSQR